jgi:hypothetical protein
VVFVCHYGGVVGYFGVVVNTPRKLHSAGPTNRDYPTLNAVGVVSVELPEANTIALALSERTRMFLALVTH